MNHCPLYLAPPSRLQAEEAGATGSLHTGPWVVWRRFNNFELLRQFLCYKYGFSVSRFISRSRDSKDSKDNSYLALYGQQWPGEPTRER